MREWKVGSIPSAVAIFILLSGALANAQYRAPQRRVEVHLVDEFGSIVDRARVQIRSKFPPVFPPAIQNECRRADAGVFECFSGPTLDATVVIEADPYPSTWRTIEGELSHDQELIIVIPGPPTDFDFAANHRIEGMVGADARRGRMQWVRIVPAHGFGTERTALVDTATGRFSMDSLTSKVYVVMLVTVEDQSGLTYSNLKLLDLKPPGVVTTLSLNE